jgi:hypothetical protein
MLVRLNGCEKSLFLVGVAAAARPSFPAFPRPFCAVTASEGMERIEGTKPRQCRRLAVARTFETSTMSRDKASARDARQLTGQRYILNCEGEVSL